MLRCMEDAFILSPSCTGVWKIHAKMCMLSFPWALAADVAFYGSGTLVTALLGSQPGARAARLPILALLFGNWAAEHWVLSRFQR